MNEFATIVSDHSPRVSIGRGLKIIPASLQGSPYLAFFLSYVVRIKLKANLKSTGTGLPTGTDLDNNTSKQPKQAIGI